MAQRDESDRMMPKETVARRKPRITQEMRIKAQANPDSWLYVVDDAFDPHGRVPSWAVVGAFPVNTDGAIIDDFHPNERYRPSPKTLGFPEPGNELERVLQLVHTRYRPAEDLIPIVLDSALYVYAFSADQRSIIGFHNNDGKVVVPAYTSKSRIPSHWPHARPVFGRDIVDLLAGHPLIINPHDIAVAVVSAEQLEQALNRPR